MKKDWYEPVFYFLCVVSHVIIGRPSGFSGVGIVRVGAVIGERTPGGKYMGADDFFCFNRWTM